MCSIVFDSSAGPIARVAPVDDIRRVCCDVPVRNVEGFGTEFTVGLANSAFCCNS